MARGKSLRLQAVGVPVLVSKEAMGAASHMEAVVCSRRQDYTGLVPRTTQQVVVAGLAVLLRMNVAKAALRAAPV